MPLQQFHPLESLLVSPLGVSARLWGPEPGWVVGEVRLPIRPLSLHIQVFSTIHPTNTRTAQSAFTAWKERVPPCCLTNLLSAQGKTCPWRGAACKVTLMPPALNAQDKLRLPHTPHFSVPLHKAKHYFHAPSVQLRLEVGPGASLGAISYSHSDQGHYFPRKL